MKKINKKTIIKSIISIIFLILSITLIIFVNSLNIIPTKYLIIATLLILILNIIATILLFIKKKWPKIITILIYIIITIISIIGIDFSTEANKFLDTAFDNAETSYSLKFYVLSQNNYTEEELNNKDIYYYENAIYVDDAIAELNKKFTVNIIADDDANELFNFDIFLIDEATLSIFNEEYNLDISIYNILYEIDLSYEIEVEDTTTNNTESESKSTTTTKTSDHYYNIYLGAYDFSGYRMDLNKIITINTESNQILITNIHRFAYLEVPGYSQRNTLSLMSAYGINNNINALENLLGINIDYYIVAKPAGLVTLVDDIGGINYCSNYSYTTTHALVIGTYDDSTGEKLKVKKGCQQLNGIETLTVARERLAFKMGAVERDNNTTDIMIDILEQMKKPSNITNYSTILNDISGLYNTSIPRDVLTQSVKKLLSNGWNIETQTITGTNGTNKTNFSNVYGSVVYISDSSVQKAVKKINSLNT